MAETGYNWGSWTACGVAAVTLTAGGTILEVSDAIDLDGKAGCLISVAATYSNHAKATGGLELAVLDDANGTYQAQADIVAGWEIPFTQNDTRLFVFSVDPKHHQLIKIMHDWNNTTGSSAVTITTQYKTATIPVAS